MKVRARMFLMACTVTTWLPCAKAQSTEVFGGFVGGVMKPENYDQFVMHGWNASATRYLNSRVGLTAEFVGIYADTTLRSTQGSNTEAFPTRQYSFMGGPQVRILRKERLETSFKALFGGAYGYIPSGVSSSGVMYDSASQDTFAAEFGSNFDFKITRKVSLRVSPGIYLTQFGSNGTQKNFRFSIGPVFHFGGGEN